MILNKKIPLSHLLGTIKYELIFVLIIGVFSHYALSIIPQNILVVPWSVPAFLGTSISILLSFKMAQSYDRWWEARKIWGSIVNDSRTLVIQLQSFLSSQSLTEQVKIISYRQIAWCYALSHFLRGETSMVELNKFLSAKEIEVLNLSKNKHLRILQMNIKHLGDIQRKKQLELILFAQLDLTISKLCDSMGKAERIKNTVFPPKYRLILRGTIFLFVILFSISMRNMEMYVEVVLLLLFSCIFLLLENTALHLQDPFSGTPSDVPITKISQTIESNIKELIEDNVSEVSSNEDNYFVM